MSRTLFSVALTVALIWQASATQSGEKTDPSSKFNAAQPSPVAARLMTFDELQKQLSDPNLRVIDCRPRREYDDGHIPGAVWIDTKSLESQAAQPKGLEDRQFWQNWATGLAIGPKTTVIVYDGKRQLDAARVWFFLRWIGANDVGLLNGSYAVWSQEQRPVTTDVPQLAPQKFQVRFRINAAASREDVLKAVRDRSATVLDARSDSEYRGTDRKSLRGGHIPAACHLEWTNFVDANGRFPDRKTLRKKFEMAGIKTGREVISHCQAGGRAAVSAFALEFAGYPARTYYRGWSDWGNAEETPVEGPLN